MSHPRIVIIGYELTVSSMAETEVR